MITLSSFVFEVDDSFDSEEFLVLYNRSEDYDTSGAAILEYVKKKKINPTRKAWDFLSLALTVLAADHLVQRGVSSDGWTRSIKIDVPVSDPDLWNAQIETIEFMLRYLTTDIWEVSFYQGSDVCSYSENEEIKKLSGDCVSLLSGGLDSLIGLIDLHQQNIKPTVVSQVVNGDKSKQSEFVKSINSDLEHIQLNHNSTCTGENSTRSRSIVFFAYGALIASCLNKYEEDGSIIDLYVCENGLISLNVPLTNTRVGSLSTRTTNPIYLSRLQALFDATGLKIKLVNPYQFKTKGEMCIECQDQAMLKKLAKNSTSCGRFARYGFQQCGRCIPCLIRRAAFKKWSQRDYSGYKFKDLSKRDSNHFAFEDVRSAGIAIIESSGNKLESWIGPALSDEVFSDELEAYQSVLRRGLDELKVLLRYFRVV